MHTLGINRPILVKLHSSWDRRAAVSRSYKLASTAGFEHVYISPDEPLETRRRRTLDRIVKKASGQGKRVTVANGAVSVNDCIVFTLDRGYVHSNG